MEEDSDFASGLRRVSKYGKGEGASEDLEYRCGSVCTPRDRVSRSSGRLFAGVAVTGSPSNSSKSRDGVVRASTCVLLPHGSGVLGYLSELGVKGS